MLNSGFEMLNADYSMLTADSFMLGSDIGMLGAKIAIKKSNQEIFLLFCRFFRASLDQRAAAIFLIRLLMFSPFHASNEPCDHKRI